MPHRHPAVLPLSTAPGRVPGKDNAKGLALKGQGLGQVSQAALRPGGKAARPAAGGVSVSGVLGKQSMETAAANTHHGARSVHSGSLCVEAYICSRRENMPDAEMILCFPSLFSIFMFQLFVPLFLMLRLMFFFTFSCPSRCFTLSPNQGMSPRYYSAVLLISIVV